MSGGQPAIGSSTGSASERSRSASVAGARGCRMTELRSGAAVRVTNLDGETTEGEVVKVTADQLRERDALWWDDDRTLADYWYQADDVSPDEYVVVVELGDRTYDYPASRVEVIEE